MLALVSVLRAQEPGEPPAPVEETEAVKDPAVINDTRIRETSIIWLHDLEKAHTLAVKLGRPLVIDFEAEWCGWCKKLDRETYTDESVIRFVNEHLVPVKLAVDKSEAHKKFSKAFGVDGLPTMLFLRVRPHDAACQHDHGHSKDPDEKHADEHADEHSGDACHESVDSYLELGRIEGFRIATVFLEDARKFVETGASLSQLETEAEKHLEDAAAQRAYARALLAAGRLDDAEKNLVRALENVKIDTAGLRLDLGDLYRQTGKYASAVGIFRTLINSSSGDNDVHLARRAALLPMARCLVSLGQMNEAEASLNSLLDGVADRLAGAKHASTASDDDPTGAPPSFLDKDDLEGLFLRAYLRAHLGRSREAVTDMKTAEEADANGPWGLRAGFILQRLED
jgi:thioredoxin-like negative regulator of GroEL